MMFDVISVPKWGKCRMVVAHCCCTCMLQTHAIREWDWQQAPEGNVAHTTSTGQEAQGWDDMKRGERG